MDDHSEKSEKSAKAAYVARESSGQQSSDHHCHWPGCTVNVPPARWGCYKHWMTLPRRIRNRIWAAYRPGQEKDKRPSAEYLEAASEARRWILETLATIEKNRNNMSGEDKPE